MNWDILDTGRSSAEENMRIDASLLSDATSFARPLIHFYEWEGKCATYGHFIEPRDFLDLSKAQAKGLSLARRSTGGGIVFHIWDLAFSVVVPAHCPEFSTNTLDNYHLINRAVLRAIARWHGKEVPLELSPEGRREEVRVPATRFCMAHPTHYDVMWEGRKVAGSAQRKTRSGFLHQGTISLLFPSEEFLADLFLPDSGVWEAMVQVTHPLLPQNAGEKELAAARQELRTLLAQELQRSYPEASAIQKN